MRFVANKHKPRGSVHTMLLPCSIYPRITLPVWPVGAVICVRKRQVTRAGAGRTGRFRVFFAAHAVGEVADLAQSDLKLLWVVRPCLWLKLRLMTGCWRLFPVCGALCSLASNAKRHTRCQNRPHSTRRKFWWLSCAFRSRYRVASTASFRPAPLPCCLPHCYNGGGHEKSARSVEVVSATAVTKGLVYLAF